MVTASPELADMGSKGEWLGGAREPLEHHCLHVSDPDLQTLNDSAKSLIYSRNDSEDLSTAIFSK